MNSELRKVNEKTTKSEIVNLRRTRQDQEPFSPNYRPRRRFLAATIC